MFLLTLFGQTKPYSTKQLAEKNAANFIRVVLLNNRDIVVSNSHGVGYFNAAFQKEDYQSCCRIWNDHVMIAYYGESLRKINIQEQVLDTVFT